MCHLIEPSLVVCHLVCSDVATAIQRHRAAKAACRALSRLYPRLSRRQSHLPYTSVGGLCWQPVDTTRTVQGSLRWENASYRAPLGRGGHSQNSRSAEVCTAHFVNWRNGRAGAHVQETHCKRRYREGRASRVSTTLVSRTLHCKQKQITKIGNLSHQWKKKKKSLDSCLTKRWESNNHEDRSGQPYSRLNGKMPELQWMSGSDTQLSCKLNLPPEEHGKTPTRQEFRNVVDIARPQHASFRPDSLPVGSGKNSRAQTTFLIQGGNTCFHNLNRDTLLCGM